MEEEWKEFTKKPHKYKVIWEVSNFGNVRRNGKIRKQQESGWGYKMFCGGYYTHVAVAELFIGEIPEGYQVDHVDTNKHNNRLDNLRICSRKENMSNPLTKQHQIIVNRNIAKQNKIKLGYPVIQLTKEGNFIKRYNSLSEAFRETGIPHIREIILGDRKNNSGYDWVYEKDYINNNDIL